ncbi:MAG: PDZ domain-containing protein [Acidobacteriota bacterium]|nr:PDZ domain-containing protein [Acidobacteriota bacterium]
MLNRKCFLLLLFIFSLFVCPIFTQIRVDEIASPANAKLNRSRGLIMLDEVKDLIKQNYYDKQYRGIDIDELFKIAKEKVKTLDSNWEIFRVIAQVVMEFNDSHTRFYPLNRANRVEYGFSMQMIGNNCFVTDVKKGSDAETKGLRIGDVIVRVGNFNPTRENLWKMQYLLYVVDPQESVILYVLNPDKTSREIEILSAFRSAEDRRKETEKRRTEKQENPYNNTFAKKRYLKM